MRTQNQPILSCYKVCDASAISDATWNREQTNEDSFLKISAPFHEISSANENTTDSLTQLNIKNKQDVRLFLDARRLDNDTMTQSKAKRRLSHKGRLHLIKRKDDQTTESFTSKSSFYEPEQIHRQSYIENSFSSSAALSFKDMVDIDIPDLEKRNGQRLISQTTLTAKFADIDLDTASGDSCGQLSSDWFNPQENGCDSPV